jgi:hypothetical protein
LPTLVGHGAQESFGGLDGQTVHRIEVVLPRSLVAPQDVGLAVAIEIARSRDAPILIGDGSNVSLAQDRGAVHQVNVVLAAACVPPEDVALAVAIEVAGADDLPVRITHHAQVSFCAKNRRAVHRI